MHNPCDGFAEFNTGAPNSTTLNELIECAEKVTGKKAIIEQCDVPPGDAHTVGHPSFELIKEKLGWTPKVDVEEGMRLTYLDYLRQMKDQSVGITNHEVKPVTIREYKKGESYFARSDSDVTGEEKKAADSSRSRRGSSFMERRRSSVHESNDYDVSDLIGELTLGEMEDVEDLEVDDDFA